MNAKLALVPTFALVITGCYGAAPGRPPTIPLPTLSDGAQLSVHTETNTKIENVQKHSSTCPAGHGEGDPACVVTTYSVAEPVTRVTTTAALDAAPINFAQFKVITDPKWDNKLSELDDLSHKCQRANKPRYAGMGLMLGGLLVGSIVIAAGSEGGGQAVMYGGLGAGAVAYALGYFAFGGRDCVEARNLYNAMDLSRQQGWDTVEGEDYAVEMRTLAEQFNAAHGGNARASVPAAAEPVEPVIEVEPAKPVKPVKKAKKPAKAAAKPSTVALRMRSAS